VEFEVVSDGKYARPIADFRRQHYSPALFRLLSGPTVSTFGVMAPGIFAVMAPPKSTEIRGSNGPQA
jgi:hypothetical protein